MAFQRLRGFKDLYGSESAGFAAVEAAAREVFSAFGFDEIRTPVLEAKEVFTRALGTQTDVVQKEMYEFTDRSKVHVALRPEGTAGVVRAYLENNLHKTQGLAKFYYMGPMFRSERPQAGRLRQFHQVGVETLGTDHPLADAESVHCLASFLEKAGVRDFQVKVNNLGTFEEREAFQKVLRGYFKPVSQKLCEDCRLRLEKNVFRVLDCKVQSCRELVRQSPPISEHLSEGSRNHFSDVLSALASAGIQASEDVHMVRGLDYYTKTVFEIVHPKLGAQDAIAAGGRYDHLVESFGGPRTGAVGFAVGVERLLMTLEEGAAPAVPSRSIFIAALGEGAVREGFGIVSKLRSAGTRAQMDFAAKSLKSQMRSADKAGATHVVILGENELKKKMFTLKDMKDGTQKEIGLENAVRELAGSC